MPQERGRHATFFGTGRSRENVSNDRINAESGKQTKIRQTSLKEQGNCREIIGNNNGNAATGQEKPQDTGLRIVINRTPACKSRSEDDHR